MALDYILWKDCEIQKGRELTDVFRISKLRDMLGYAETQKEEMLARNPGKTFDEIGVQSVNAQGEVKETTLGDMRREWQETVAVAQTCCKGCTLNYRKREIGCFNAITYPIRTSMERWLIENFNPPSDLPSGVLGFIHNFDYHLTGEHADAQRPSQPGENALFESPTPIARKLENASALQVINQSDPEEISSSQIIELLWTNPTPGPLLLWSLCLEFGAIEPSVEDRKRVIQLLGPRLDDLLPKPTEDGGIQFTTYLDEDLMSGCRLGPHDEEGAVEFNEIVQRTTFGLKTKEDDDESVWRIKSFLVACWIALSKNAELRSDG